jgi:hypothetical protein
MRKPSLCGDLSPYAKGPFQHHGRPSRGNGDGAELEAEVWKWDGGKWDGASSSGAGPLDQLGPVRTGGQIGSAYFAYGSAPGRRSVTIDFDGHLHHVPVSRYGVWAFIKVRTDPHGLGFPFPAA